MQPAESALGLTQALALGLAQGPTELLPISSSAHTALLSRLAGWRYEELDGTTRKSFELALHGGAGLALALALRGEVRVWARHASPRAVVALGLALAGPALAGAALRGRIERRAGGARALGAGMLAGAGAMALADAGPWRHAGSGRPCADFGAVDGVALGLAQALALAPGVSRSGAALTAARARGFDRAGAQSLSLALALPLLIGAGAADAAGMAGARPGAAGMPARALGACAAFVSTLASARLLLRRGWRERPLLPYALYRCAVAALVLGRAGHGR